MRITGRIAGDFLGLLGRSWIAAVGAVVTTAAAVLFAVVFAIDATSAHANPYRGILAFFVLPAILVLGLLLIPLGAWMSRKRRPEDRASVQAILQDPAIRRRLVLVSLATFVNVAILTTASFRAVEVMDTREFCGQTCHSVMAPEATALPHAPHARVLCVSCHVGPGAQGFVRAKLNGISQLAALATGTYHRPIPVPIEGASPARAVCLDCHALSQFKPEKLRIIRSFASDEGSTPVTSVLVLKVGGLDERSGHPRGIHWHVFPENIVEYQAQDKARSTISRVRVRPAGGGTVREYAGEAASGKADGASGGAGPSGEQGAWHRMDCVDCHNRPAHSFELPGRAVDRALAGGDLDRSLPWIKKNAVEVLTRVYPDAATARTEIPRRFAELSANASPGAVGAAGKVLQEIYARNVFPQMGIGWGTYPNHIGHMDSPGCFRCHDGAHTTPDGKTITADCSACHTLVAVEETAPEILKALEPDAVAP